MSQAQNLIDLGRDIVQRNKKEGLYGSYYVTGAEYEEWVAKVIFFMEDNKEKFPEFLYNRVIEAANNAVGNGEEYFDRIIGVLSSFVERV